MLRYRSTAFWRRCTCQRACHPFWGTESLQQVILNLIMNAIEAMSEISEGSRELLINTSIDAPGSVIVAVRDSGPGLSPATLARIFEAFYTTKASGLGIGLSICRSIVEAHGGRLQSEPNPGGGAIFRFTLAGIGRKGELDAR